MLHLKSFLVMGGLSLLVGGLCWPLSARVLNWFQDDLLAEANAILKVARSTQSCEGATLYITLSPCQQCSKLIHQAGIKRVVYSSEYKDASGLEFLEKAGVELTFLSVDE